MSLEWFSYTVRYWMGSAAAGSIFCRELAEWMDMEPDEAVRISRGGTARLLSASSSLLSQRTRPVVLSMVPDRGTTRRKCQTANK